MEQIFAKVLPILILITFGYIIKRTSFLDNSVFSGIKKIVFNIALPSILFLSFINIELKFEYIGLNLWVITLLFLLNMLGRLFNRINKISNLILPYVLSGTTFALLGIVLYSTAFGSDNIAYFTIMAIGHEIYIWIIYISLMRIDLSGEKFTFKGFVNIIKSPLIVSILLSVLLNILGLSSYFTTNPILSGINQTLNYLAQLATPLILLIVGYDLEFNPSYTRLSVIFTLIRRISLVGFGFAMAFLVLPRIMELTNYHIYALMIFFMLPPPFGLSTFIELSGGSKKDSIIGNNVVVLDTILCIITFICFIFVINL